jgi:hypothetical protein
MKTSRKVLASIPFIIGILMFVDFMTINYLWQSFPGMEAYRIRIISVFTLSVFSWSFILRRIWSFEYVPRIIKVNWTLYILLLFGPIMTLYYIWIKDEEFIKKDIQPRMKN